MSTRSQVLADLREKVEKIEGVKARPHATLAFGVDAIDRHLPGGGLAYGAIHEVAGGGSDAVFGAAAAQFVAGVAARSKGTVLWCLSRQDLFAPALAQVGLHPDRVIFVEGDDEAAIMSSFEEALRWRGLAAVVAELVRLPMTESRRFQLAAEGACNIGLIIRRWRRNQEATDFGNPTASATRWRVSSMPSQPLPVPGVGTPRWLLELMRARGSDSRDWTVEACDQRGFMRLAAETYTANSSNSDVGISGWGA
jgi:protein ImuA